MASSVDAALADLYAARADLAPDIRGIEKIQNDSFTQQAINDIHAQGERLVRRDERLAAAIAALEALNSDGYPELPPYEVDPDVKAELDLENSDVTAAVATFVVTPEVSSATITFNAFVDKP